MAKAMEQERREAKSRTSALPGQRRLRRRVQGEDYLPKEDDFALSAQSAAAAARASALSLTGGARLSESSSTFGRRRPKP
uniref:Uncharacterized protein n=1 Tax=Oryza sativa subsp. japonica TaxID=39947 RepID=Q69KH7_ORYSJ|nr:hypothetical protein [Oryza sativa Japonica Group]BAD36563.1 hypothetical protein [Oryza sativa Japonica Group]